MRTGANSTLDMPILVLLVLLAETFWTAAAALQELPIEIGKTLKAAGVSDFRHGGIGFHEQFSRVADAHFLDEVRQGTAGNAFEIMAEGGEAHAQRAGDFPMIESP